MMIMRKEKKTKKTKTKKKNKAKKSTNTWILLESWKQHEGDNCSWCHRMAPKGAEKRLVEETR